MLLSVFSTSFVVSVAVSPSKHQRVKQQQACDPLGQLFALMRAV
jgi:hypothetical protein